MGVGNANTASPGLNTTSKTEARLTTGIEVIKIIHRTDMDSDFRHSEDMASKFKCTVFCELTS